MKTKLLFFVIAFGLLIINTAYAQQGKSDAAFNTYDGGLFGDGFDGAVRTLSLQPDGKLIVGGEFLNFNGIATPYLCRLFPDGSKDPSFVLGTGFVGNVYSSLLQPDGKIIIGGSFTSFNGSAAGKLIRLNADGSRDFTFNTSIGASTGIVHAIAMQTDGSLIIAGSFTKYNTITVNKIAKILPNGNLDVSFLSGSGANGVVDSVQIQSDGRIVIGGSFTLFNGVYSNRIIRLNADGTLDDTFSIGTGFDGIVRTLAIQPDGKILVGGDFVNYNGNQAGRIIRLNPDASIDSGFVSGIGFSDDGVYAIKLDSNGLIMVGGSFDGQYNGINVNRLILLDSNGVLKPNFDIGSGPDSATVLALLPESVTSWYVGGSFFVFDSQNQGRLAKIDGEGVLNISYLTAGVGFDNSVLKVISLQDKKTMTFGSFTKFNGTSISRIARLQEDGTVDSSFNPSGTGVNEFVKTAILQSDTKIVIAGNFTAYNGIMSNRIARVLPEGAIDPTFVTGNGFNNQVYALALQEDGKIIVGGNFTSYNGTAVNRIVRLSADGSIDASFNIGLGADAIVEVLLIQADGKILLGGRFSTFNGISHSKLVRLNTNGSVDSGFSIGMGFDKYVFAMALQSDDKIVIGGTFLNYDGIPAKRMLRLNTNGNIDPSFTSGSGFSNGEVRAILIQPDNRLLVGGTFSGTYNGKVVKRMVRLQPNGVCDPTFVVNLNSTLYSICFTPDAKVMIGGNFNSVSGITKHRVARLKLCINSSVWNGISWSNTAPSLGKELIFNGDYNITSTVNSCSCAINTGNTVTIKAGNTLGLTFDYSGLGTLILENNAALYQSDDEIVNTGTIVLKRETTPIIKTDYTYWSSPVSNQSLLEVSPNTDMEMFYSFDATTDLWHREVPTNSMEVGKGYIIRGPQDFSTTIPVNYEAVFMGVPNNGKVSIPITLSDTSNLLGNPYPSAIDADVFLAVNSEVLDGTIYFWTHNTPFTNNVYASNDYAVYNLLGGVGTNSALNSGVNSTVPNGKIASGQGFFTTSIKSGGTVVFNNSMRIREQNSNFFKSNGIKKSKLNGIEKHRFWLNFSNSEGAFKQALIGYITDATNDYDGSFDGETFDGNDFVDFYSISQSKKLVIQGRGLPFDDRDAVLLGYRTTIAGAFTISIDQLDGLFINQSVFVEDKVLNLVHNIKDSPYSFTTQIGVFNDRFVLRYLDKSLGSNAFNKVDNGVIVSKDRNELKVKSASETIKRITAFDLQGRIVLNKKDVNSNEFRSSDFGLSKQIALIKVTLSSGQVVSKKVIF